MLCAGISHKILHTDTVYDYLGDLFQSSHNFYDRAEKMLVGEIVLTRYSNKIYCIDEIDRKENPRSTFTTPNGEISFVEYYCKAYGAEIYDLEQPLLVNQPKISEIRARGEDARPSCSFQSCAPTQVCQTGLGQIFGSWRTLLFTLVFLLRVGSIHWQWTTTNSTTSS